MQDEGEGGRAAYKLRVVPRRCDGESQQTEHSGDVRLCRSTLTTVGNEGAWLLPPRLQGWGPPGKLQLIEMEIQEVMLQREEVSRSPCQSDCLFVLRRFITVTFCSH